MTVSAQTSQVAHISGIAVPSSKLANEITEFIRDTESTLLFNHSSRVYYFGALAGQGLVILSDVRGISPCLWYSV